MKKKCDSQSRYDQIFGSRATQMLRARYNRFSTLQRGVTAQDSSGGEIEGELREGGSLQHSPNNRARRNPAWRDRASGISRECIAVFIPSGATYCTEWKSRDVGMSSTWNIERRLGMGRERGLIEILIAGIRRPRAQHPCM